MPPQSLVCAFAAQQLRIQVDDSGPLDVEAPVGNEHAGEHDHDKPEQLEQQGGATKYEAPSSILMDDLGDEVG